MLMVLILALSINVFERVMVGTVGTEDYLISHRRPVRLRIEPDFFRYRIAIFGLLIFLIISPLFTEKSPITI